MIDGIDEVTEELERLMGMMRPAQRKKAIRQALMHLRNVNKQRITAQQNPDGTAYKVRKQSVNVGKTRVQYLMTEGNERSFVGTLGSARNSDYVKLSFDDGKSINLRKAGIIKKQKVRANKKNMLTGFRKFMMLKMYGADKGVINFKPQARRVARQHHFGHGAANLPARQLLGMSEQDKLDAMRIMLAVLLENQN